MKKIVFLTTRLPQPTNDGRSKTLEQYILLLTKHYEVDLISFNNNKSVDEQDKSIKSITLLKSPSFITKILNVITLSFFKKLPLQISAVYSKNNQKKFNQKINEIKPDVIICDMIRTSRFVMKLKYKCKTILDMDDILSKRYIQSQNKDNNPLGQLKESLPKIFVKLIEIFKLQRKILKFEGKRMKRMETNVCNYFDSVVLVSPIEVNNLSQVTNQNNIYCWPVAIKNTYLPTVNYDKQKLCFLGNMDVSQNQETLNYILTKIMPKLKKYKLIVVGKCSNESLKLFKSASNVLFTKEVDDVKPYVRDCLCLLAPIQYGSGIKIKILESMSLGVPVITSNIGVEGLNVTNGSNILIANSEDEYIQKIELLSNDVIRQEIANESVKYIEQNHSYSLSEKIIVDSIEKLW